MCRVSRLIRAPRSEEGGVFCFSQPLFLSAAGCFLCARRRLLLVNAARCRSSTKTCSECIKPDCPCSLGFKQRCWRKSAPFLHVGRKLMWWSYGQKHLQRHKSCFTNLTTSGYFKRQLWAAV